MSIVSAAPAGGDAPARAKSARKPAPAKIAAQKEGTVGVSTPRPSPYGTPDLTREMTPTGNLRHALPEGEVPQRAKSARKPSATSKGEGRKTGRDPGPKKGEAAPRLEAQVVRIDVTWGEFDELPIVVTDRSNEAAVVASRRWLEAWTRVELSFKGVVMYIPPPGWEIDDFLC